MLLLASCLRCKRRTSARVAVAPLAVVNVPHVHSTRAPPNAPCSTSHPFLGGPPSRTLQTGLRRQLLLHNKFNMPPRSLLAEFHAVSWNIPRLQEMEAPRIIDADIRHHPALVRGVHLERQTAELTCERPHKVICISQHEQVLICAFRDAFHVDKAPHYPVPVQKLQKCAEIRVVQRTR
jgi:hypothetical protein